MVTQSSLLPIFQWLLEIFTFSFQLYHTLNSAENVRSFALKLPTSFPSILESLCLCFLLPVFYFLLPKAEALSELLPTPLPVLRYVATSSFSLKHCISFGHSLCAQTTGCSHSMVAGFPQKGPSQGGSKPGGCCPL